MRDAQVARPDAADEALGCPLDQLLGNEWPHLRALALPFGGFRQSGRHREKGRDVLELYTEVKSVVTAL